MATQPAPEGNYLTAQQAQELDEVLMGEEAGFTLEQLMELAGLSIAQCVRKVYPPREGQKRVLVCCGPGNQGGDGLVAARHLMHFGYSPSVFWPKEGKNAFYQKLKKQCENHEFPFIAPPISSLSSFPASPNAQQHAFERALQHTDVVVDCVFGFSFKGPPREPFVKVLEAFKSTTKPIVSVDIPSGWDVEAGNTSNGFTPAVLLSLSAPKLGVRQYAEEGRRHYLGGRFIPRQIEHKIGIDLPRYPGADQCVDITISKAASVL